MFVYFLFNIYPICVYNKYKHIFRFQESNTLLMHALPSTNQITHQIKKNTIKGTLKMYSFSTIFFK